jgi:hypothetical protein
MSRTQAQWVYREACLLARQFGTVEYDDEDGRWVEIPHFPLPAGWDRPATGLLLVLPNGYPHVPPDGFYMDRCLRIRRGQKVGHYFEEGGIHNPYAAKGWAWFCIHPDREAWYPTSDLVSGDNLFKLVALIRAILTEAVVRER